MAIFSGSYYKFGRLNLGPTIFHRLKSDADCFITIHYCNIFVTELKLSLRKINQISEKWWKECNSYDIFSYFSIVNQWQLWRSRASKVRPWVSAKVTRLKYSLLFNSTCVKEGILPTYTKDNFGSPNRFRRFVMETTFLGKFTHPAMPRGANMEGFLPNFEVR